MINFKKLYNAYLLTKVRKYYANRQYEKALKIIKNMDFKNKAYFNILIGMLFFYSNSLNESKKHLNVALEKLSDESFFNKDEKNHLTSYIYYSLALIFKQQNKKDLSMEMLSNYHKYYIFNIDNIREYLLYDFPLEKE